MIMKIMKYSVLLILYIAIINIVPASAQNSNQNGEQSRPFLGFSRDAHTPQLLLSVDPFPLLNGRLKLNLEKQINNDKNKYFVLTLSGFYLPEKEDREWEGIISGSDYFKKLNGYNIEGAYKQFFPHSQLYWQAGIGYTFSRVKYLKYDYYPYIEDGLQFYEYLGKDIKKNFHKISPNINIGIQSSISGWVFIDIFIGLSYNHAFYNGREVFSDYRGFGYRGISYNGGINIGIPLKR